MNHGNLFRREALDARQSGLNGEVSVTCPMPLRIYAYVTVAVAVALVVLAFGGSYSRHTRVSGQLIAMGGISTVAAPASGTLRHVVQLEGKSVFKGAFLGDVNIAKAVAQSGDVLPDVLRELDVQATTLVDERASTRTSSRVEATALLRQMQESEQLLNKLDGAVRLQRQQTQLARQELARFESLLRQQYVSVASVAQQRSSVLISITDEETLERQSIQVRAQLSDLRGRLAQIPARTGAAELQLLRHQAELRARRLAMQPETRSALIADVGGTVVTQTAFDGMHVEAGQSLYTILPMDGTLGAQLLVPSRAVGFISVGDRVHLRYVAFPYQKFGHQTGIVTSVSISALAPDQVATVTGGTSAVEPMYRVLVRPDRQFVPPMVAKSHSSPQCCWRPTSSARNVA